MIAAPCSICLGLCNIVWEILKLKVAGVRVGSHRDCHTCHLKFPSPKPSPENSPRTSEMRKFVAESSLCDNSCELHLGEESVLPLLTTNANAGEIRLGAKGDRQRLPDTPFPQPAMAPSMATQVQFLSLEFLQSEAAGFCAEHYPTKSPRGTISSSGHSLRDSGPTHHVKDTDTTEKGRIIRVPVFAVLCAAPADVPQATSQL
jgi:hypothetical protein